jgi:NAD(P)-dependent dehydrogenase (short-subunit alcohol dehydrogenase family)
MKRVCLLTGASGTLGTAFVRRCFAQYQIIAICNRHAPQFPTMDQSFVDPLDPTRFCEENNNRAFEIHADLSDPGVIDSLCQEVIDRFRQVDLLINAAAHRQWVNLRSTSGLQDAPLTLAVNVLAPLRLTASLAEKFWSAHRDENIRLSRNVLNVSSTAGVYVYPDLGQGIYSASKAALNYATYHLASELWHIGIRVNAIAPDTFPGLVLTDKVVDEILMLDRATDTGRVVILKG